MFYDASLFNYEKLKLTRWSFHFAGLRYCGTSIQFNIHLKIWSILLKFFLAFLHSGLHNNLYIW